MLHTLGLLLGCQLLGELTVRGFGLLMPGPVLGLALLVLILGAMPTLAERLRPTTTEFALRAIVRESAVLYRNFIVSSFEPHRRVSVFLLERLLSPKPIREFCED